MPRVMSDFRRGRPVQMWLSSWEMPRKVGRATGTPSTFGSLVGGCNLICADTIGIQIWPSEAHFLALRHLSYGHESGHDCVGLVYKHHAN